MPLEYWIARTRRATTGSGCDDERSAHSRDPLAGYDGVCFAGAPKAASRAKTSGEWLFEN
jgi:hypothetical protein